MNEQFFSSESDYDVIEDSPQDEGGEEFAKAWLHGAIRVLVIRARWIEFHLNETLIAWRRLFFSTSQNTNAVLRVTLSLYSKEHANR